MTTLYVSRRGTTRGVHRDRNCTALRAATADVREVSVKSYPDAWLATRACRHCFPDAEVPTP